MTEVLCCWCSMAVWQTLLSVPVHGPQCWQKQTFMLAHQVIMFCLIKSLCAVSLTVHMPLEGVDVTFFILCTAFGFFCGLSPTDSNMVWQFNHWHGNSIIVNRSHGNCHLQCTCCWPMWAEIVICSVPVADLCEQKLSFAVYLLLTYVSSKYLMTRIVAQKTEWQEGYLELSGLPVKINIASGNEDNSLCPQHSLCSL